MRVTEQGARILQKVRELMRDFADLRSVANESPISGELRLGACPTALAGMLPGILARMVGKFPQINVYIRPGYSAQLYSLGRGGRSRRGLRDPGAVRRCRRPATGSCCAKSR